MMEKRRILLVEDEPLIRMIMAEALEDEGLTVVQAENGDVAAELIDGSNGYDALLTDIHMPGQRDGVAVAAHYRERHPAAPIIYMSGRPDALRRAAPLGPREVLLHKPYAPSDLMRVLTRLFSL
jgi:CheY-like chemotaxis protein